MFGLALLASPFVGVLKDIQWVDAVTGSMRRQTVWPFGTSRGVVTQASPLELELCQRGIRWSADWRFLSEADRTLLGNATSRGCGVAPPIYQIRSVLGQFASASSNDELREFVRVMQSGSEDERRAAVDGAGDKGLSAGRSGTARLANY